MIQAPLYTKEGEALSTVEVEDALFGMRWKPDLVHQAIVAQMANARIAIAHTKGRGEVRGGGAKPWRQKGTGRARHGSIRSPLWVGGGVTFGPTKERNYAQKINKRMKLQALSAALSQKLRDREVYVLEKWNIEAPKTKALAAFLHELNEMFSKGESKKKQNASFLLVHEGNEYLLRAVRNLPYATAIRGDSLNIIDVLRHTYVIFSKESLAMTQKCYHR